MIDLTAKERVLALWSAGKDPLAPQLFSEGYRLPDLDRLTWYAVGDEADDNWIVTEPDRPKSFGVQFRSQRGNVFIIGRNSSFAGEVYAGTSNSTFIIGEDSGHGSNARLRIHGNGTGCILFIGAQTTANEATFFLHGNAQRIVIGEDCMLADRVVVRTGDDHSIVDAGTGEWMNIPRSVSLEPHVWVCPESLLLKGSSIGFGSIVASKSIVSRATPRFVLVGGAPQALLRRDVTWDRPERPRHGIHQHMRDWAERIVPLAEVSQASNV